MIMLIERSLNQFKHCKGQTIVAIKGIQGLSPVSQARDQYEWLARKITIKFNQLKQFSNQGFTSFEFAMQSRLIL